MIRVRCEEQKLRELTRRHMNAIQGYIGLQSSSVQEELYAAVSALTALPPPVHPDFASASKAGDWSWLERLILADVSTLRRLTIQDKLRLQFRYFADMYSKHFSRTPETYLYGDYNAYSLIEGLGLHICPYCDEEPAEIFQAAGKKRRSAQLDHFFPKGEYAALAMCFFNLVPSGSCNLTKHETALGVSPYETDIETQTCLFPDIDLGVNLAALTPEDCPISFHASAGMVRNIRALGLEDRYKKYQGEAYELLKKIQFYNRTKQEELSREFFAENGDELRKMLGLDLPAEQDWGQKPLTKLRHDILITAAGPEGRSAAKVAL